MRQRQKATMMLALALMWPAMGFSQQTAEELYQAGLYQEEAQGDLQRAIAIYERILREHPQSRVAAAQAQLHIGLCYETLGQTEAQRAYEQVIQNFADQPEVVSQARARLSALRPAAVAGRGPVARRLLSGEDTDINNLIYMTPSPDGRRIAYTQLGSDQALYVRDLATGEEQRLASGLPRIMNFSPIWSPDGRRLAFLEADMESGSGAVKIIDLASRDVITVPGTSSQNLNPWNWGRNLTPTDWSADGRFLVCRTTADKQQGGLVLVPISGGTITTLADSVAPEHKASLSPDGLFVAYAAGMQGSEQVFVQPLTGGARRQVTDAPGGNGSPLWSPDGRAIAYQRSDGVWVVPIANGAASGTPQLAYASADTRIASAWTEAGGLYFSLWNRVATPYQFPVTPATGQPLNGAPQELPSHPQTPSVFTWSPDMRHVAFARSDSPELSIYSEDRDVLAAFSVDPEPMAWRLGWSADSKEVLYQSIGRASTVLALDPATGRVREIIPPSEGIGGYSLSADGRRMLYFQRAGEGANGLFVAETGQANGMLVAPEVDPDGVPLSRVLRYQISPRGDQVLLGRQSNLSTGQYDPAAGTLWVVASDGTGTRRLGTPVYVITSAVWDPSGRFIAYTGMADSTTSVLRVVEVATGAEHDVRLPNPKAAWVRVTDWSPDGRYLGVVIPEDRVEYWVVQGLQEGVR